jgi:phage recombination protein Bet
MSNALAVSKFEFDQEQLAVIEAQFFPAGASKAEQQYCFSVAKELGLNPITKEIYFVPRKQKVGDKWIQKVEPMCGRDGFLSIAHRSGQLAGMESSCSIKEVPQLVNGKWVTMPELVAECIVYRKDSKNKYVGQVNYSEYVQKTQDGKPTKFWAEKPETMIKKVAESQVLRKAFNIHGVYCPEEMGAGFESENGDIITQAIEAEYSRIEPDKSHQPIVKPPTPEESLPVSSLSPNAPPPVQPIIPSTPQPQVIEYADDNGWPDPPEPAHEKVIDAVALEVIALLDGKHISYDITIEGIDGIISAKSYDEKELLKSTGFRWSPDTKRWIYKFQNEPF